MRILVLGATGMVGHMVSLYLQETGYEVTAFSRTPFTYCTNLIGDISDFNLLKQILRSGNFVAVINCIGSLNQFAENDKKNAVLLNSYFPHFLADAVSDLPTRIIHLSTDCVFSGEIGNYCESDFLDGATFYDRSKALGELIDGINLTFRNSLIGPDMREHGIGLFNWFMRQNAPIRGYTRFYWNGVTSLTLAKAVRAAIQQNLTGVYHLVNPLAISKYMLLHYFNQFFRNNTVEIQPFPDVRANKSLRNSRDDFDFMVPSYDEMMEEMRRWIREHRSLYPHYVIL